MGCFWNWLFWNCFQLGVLNMQVLMDVFILKLICIAFIFLIVFFYIINAALVQKINDENTLPQIPTYDITLFLVLK